MIFFTSFHVDVKVIFERQVNKKNRIDFLRGDIAAHAYIISHNDLQSLVRPKCNGTSDREEGSFNAISFCWLATSYFHGHTVKSK